MSEENKEVKLESTGEIVLPQIDLTEFVGKDVDIVKITELKGKHGYFIKVETEVVKTIEREDKEDILLCGSRLFGLHEDEQGNIGWGEKTILGVYLKKKNVDHYNKLMGTSVKLQTSTSDKTGTDFLTFN